MNTRIPPQLQSSRAGPNTRCQKCLQFGHFSYNCKSKTPYVARQSRSKQLAEAGDVGSTSGAGELFGRNKNMGKPSVAVPDEFKKGPAGVGLADEILKAKEEARKRLGIKEKDKGKKDKKKRRSPSSSSDSDSDSASSISRSPPRKRRSSSTPPRREKDRRRSPSPQRRRRRSSASPVRRSRSPRRP